MILSLKTQRTLVVLAASAAAMAGFLDQTIVGVALPTIRSDLNLSAAASLWVMTGYLLPLASLAAAFGSLGRAINEHRLFTLGIVTFVVGSITAGLSTGDIMIITARVIQGVGAAAMFTASQAMVANAFPKGRRGRGIAIYVAVTTLSLSAGPFLGGLFTDTIGWRWLFFINPVIALMAVPFIFKMTSDLPQAPRIPLKRPFDVLGLLLLVIGLATVVLGLDDLTKAPTGQSWLLGWPLAVVGVALLVWLVVHERRHPNPLLHLSFFQRPTFLASVAVIMTVGSMQMWGIITFPAYLQSSLGMSAFAAGTGLVPLTIALTLGQFVAGRAVDKLGPRTPIILGLAIALVGVLEILFTLTLSTYWAMLPGLILIGFGLALCQTPANTTAMNAVHATDRMEVSGVLGTARQTSGLLGLAIWTGVGMVAARLWSGFGNTPAVELSAGLIGGAVTIVVTILAVRIILARHTSTPPEATRD